MVWRPPFTGRTLLVALLLAVGALCSGGHATRDHDARARGATVGAIDAAKLQAALKGAVEDGALKYNTSFVAAVYTEDVHGHGPIEVSHAAGLGDRVQKIPISMGSAIPSGSVTKSFTAMRVMQLAKAGKLGPDGINTPIHTFVDPWLAKQTPPQPPLLTLWAGNTVITSVTVIQVMGMAAGLQDYVDPVLQAWTRAHKGQDFLPVQFITSLNKTFLYPPGKGLAYSSDGFVLLGMLIASVEGKWQWEDVDQMAVLAEGVAPFTLNDTLFMKTGPCSQYPSVVHQYAMASAFAETRADVLQVLTPYRHSALRTVPNPESPQCSPTNWTHGLMVNGYLIPAPQTNFASAEACCAYASTFPISIYTSQWSFLPNGTCLLMYAALGPPTPMPGAVTGTVISPPLRENEFYDMYTESCLNGWTMGNIATSPRDIARFFYSVFHARVVPQPQLDEMMAWKYFTSGFMACPPGTPASMKPQVCMGYGLGLMSTPELYRAAPGACDNNTVDCICAGSGAQRSCNVILVTQGHAGDDWGSSMPIVGWVPRLNASVVVATNSAAGMNFTGLSARGNIRAPSAVSCQVLAAIAPILNPEFPRFLCY